MGDIKSESAKQEMTALHAALVRKRREDGTLDAIIALEEWETILAKTLNVMTRQTAADKTWAMNRLGLIEHRKREGVRVLEVNQ